MISAMLPFVFSVLTAERRPSAGASPASAAGARDQDLAQSPHYDRGDRARVNVRVRDDGYVVVLHTDADGRVRVLFPVDPG